MAQRVHLSIVVNPTMLHFSPSRVTSSARSLCYSLLVGAAVFTGGCNQVNLPDEILPGRAARPTPQAVVFRHSRFYAADHERALMGAAMGSNQVEHEFSLAGGALSLAVSPDGSQVFACVASGQLVCLSYGGELAYRVGVGRNPTCVVLSKDGSRAWVANQESNDISLIDCVKRRETARIPCLGGPFDLVLSPDEKRLWVSLHASGEVACLDGDKLKELGRAPVGLAPYRMAFKASSNTLYVALFDQDEVAVVDASTLAERGRIKTESGPYGVAVDASDHLFVTNIEGGSLTVASSSDLKAPPRHVPVGTRPHGVSVSADGQALYVAVEGENRISVRASSDASEKGSLTLPFAPYEVIAAQLLKESR